MGGYAMKQQVELYACIYIREFPTQALLRLRSDLTAYACVVMDGEPPLEEVCSMNTKARLLGIRRGMNRIDVHGFPQVKAVTRSHKTESTVRGLLLECAGNYSPRVEDCSSETYFLCVIDISGTESLFGPPQIIARRFLQHMHSHGLSARITISHNFHAAVCLAKAPSGRSVDVVRSGEESASLSQLPLDVLALTDEQARMLAIWGIRSLGMLEQLPEDELIARIGQDGKRLLQLARGERPHLFQPVETPFRLEERRELDFPLNSVESLMFGVALMLDQLILRANGRLVALAEVVILLELEGGAMHTRRVRPAQPGNDRQLWIRLLHLDLQTHPPQAGIHAVTLNAKPGDTSTIQFGLYSPPLPETARLDVALAQLKALLGEENVGSAVPTDSHAHDNFRLEPFSVPSNATTLKYVKKGRIGSRHIRPPQGIHVHLIHNRPDCFFFREQRFTVDKVYGPWFTEGSWWNDALWNMEYWDVIARTITDTVLYCCIARSRINNQWQIVVLYD